MMRHRHGDGSDRRFARPDDLADRRHGGHHRLHHGHRGGGRRGGRFFDYGDLLLVAIAMIAEQPRHGYEIIKGIEERMAGSYSPSPGVIYPTLSWLEDMGYTVLETETARASAIISRRRGRRFWPPIARTSTPSFPGLMQQARTARRVYRHPWCAG